MRAMEAKDGDSALHWAVFRGEERIVRLLLEVPPSNPPPLLEVPP